MTERGSFNSAATTKMSTENVNERHTLDRRLQREKKNKRLTDWKTNNNKRKYGDHYPKYQIREREQRQHEHGNTTLQRTFYDRRDSGRIIRIP